ncbi:MAG: 3-oxoacyl-ACP reductase FabG, partial [Candidatus Omnitrophica bacterium]|nr:3-oxoacyl-ACP reductase FabG [Candidatus Omnitrophota bacterium]
MSLKGKTAIISGASRGIGRAIALELAREGANISFSFLKSRKEANSLVKEIKALSVQCKAFQVDIQDFESVKSWVGKTHKTFGGLDIIVNNAGIVIDKALALTDPKEWADVINTNLTGTYNLTRASIITLLKQKSGTIINITSVCGLIGCPRQVNYSASKAGIVGFTKSLAQEIGPFNVRVNAVAPGYTETDMIS